MPIHRQSRYNMNQKNALGNIVRIVRLVVWFRRHESGTNGNRLKRRRTFITFDVFDSREVNFHKFFVHKKTALSSKGEQFRFLFAAKQYTIVKYDVTLDNYALKNNNINDCCLILSKRWVWSQ